MPAQASSEKSGNGREGEEGRPRGSVAQLALDIVHNADTPGSAAEGGSLRAHESPFAPNVGRAIVRRGSGPISSRSYGTPGGVGEPSRQEQLEMEKQAAPEKDLTLFAMRLAVLEKVASSVGTLAFIWATVVILGGYAIYLKDTDFWFVTIILVIEGTRIFSRSHELEWQHQDAGTASGTIFSRFISTLTPSGRDKVLDIPLAQHHPKRTWSTSRVPLVPFLDWIFRAEHISRLLYWMQLVAAMLATVLSVFRLSTRRFTRPNEEGAELNHAAALLIFYSLATFEALVFLLERTYWQFQIASKKILCRVNRMCGLDTKDLGTTRRFFYDVYSKCLAESIFEGLKMDMVNYALTWLQSDIPGEQLGGLRVLLTFSSRPDFSEDTLRSMGVKQGAVERLLEMVTWKNPDEHEIRRAAADLLSKLVKYNRYSTRVAAISGSIEGIFSLLSHRDGEETGAEYTRQGGSESVAAKSVETHIMGLRILKNLAKDPLNCATIGATRGLLARLVSFIDTNRAMLRNAEEPKHKIDVVKKSLELLNLLAGASGPHGRRLREEIAKIVYTISNLRNILEYGQAHIMLQDVATEILSRLAMDDDIREMIGQTGGVMRSLLALLMTQRVDGDGRQLQLAQKAGEVLVLLSLKSKDNCLKMLRLEVPHGGVVVVADGEEAAEEAKNPRHSNNGRDIVAVLIELVSDWDVGDLSMSILRSFCAYSEHHSCKARIATSCTKQVFKLAVERSGRAQEAALGLLAKTVLELDAAQLERMLEEEALSAEVLAAKLAKLLERNLLPMTALPRLRRFCVELAVGLTERHPIAFLPAFRALKFRNLLHRLADSISELENYATFSGAIGVTLHSVTMSRLVDNAIDSFSTTTTHR